MIGKYNVNSFVNEMTRDLTRQKESILAEQLGDLVKRGILVCEESQPAIVYDHTKDKYLLQQTVKLTVREKEYIEKLERENAELKQKLDAIKGALG